jgi:putative DNA primase/helicase
MFYAPKPGFIMPDLPERPTQDQARAALEMFKKPIACFPFKAMDRAVALSGMMIAACRNILGNAPLTLIGADAPGSGKGKFVQVMAAIALGRRAPAVPPGHDRKELAKRVVAHLLTGTPFIYLDNLEEALGGADLCSVLTESPVNLRRLGGSDEGLIEAKITAVAAGNGLKAVGDMTRRAQSMSINWGLAKLRVARR